MRTIRGRVGFSLIELLVVIAIIAILAAILFPIFLAARAKAHQTRCMANLKQMGNATALYMDDYNGRYPTWLTYNDKMKRDEGSWYFVTQKYSKTKLLVKCPGLVTKGALISYWTNGYLNNWDAAPPMLESAVRLKNSTVYLSDGPQCDAIGAQRAAQHNWYGPPTAWADVPECRDAERRHNGGANVLFCDWHVSTVRPGEYQTNMKGTASSCPLNGYWTVPSPWNEKGDGHPWYRPD